MIDKTHFSFESQGLIKTKVWPGMIQGDLNEAILQILAIGDIFIEQSQDFTFPCDWMFGSLMSVNDLTTSIDHEISEVPWNSLVSTCFGG